MMKKSILCFIITLCAAVSAMAQSVKATWEFSNPANLSACTITGDASATGVLSSSYALGNSLTVNGTMATSGADSGYSAVSYTPAFTQLTPSAQVSTATAGHQVALGLTPAAGHTLKVTKISFDAAKCGTDNGGIEVKIKPSGGTEQLLEAVTPLRNKITSGNSLGYSHHEINVQDFIVNGTGAIVLLYIENITANSKQMALRNIVIEGAVDEKVFTAGELITGLTFQGTTGTVSLYDLVKGLKNGESTRYATKLNAEPTDFKVTAVSGYTADVTYQDKSAKVTIKEGETVKLSFNVTFTVTTKPLKPGAKPLKRGLMAVNLVASGSSGNLVSWRSRKTDNHNYGFKLFRGTSATSQGSKLNGGEKIYGKTNFLDTGGNTASYYKLEVYNEKGELIETEVSGKTWANQNYRIPLGMAPKDPTSNGATYTPNDASYCDMDGDGEYEIILKWSPSNEMDAASSGTTSPIFIDCVKMDGTRLWRMHSSPNQFTSAHTHQFIAWDFDGDGYGELMMKTAPGTVDGQGNYVLLGSDSPTANLKSGRGKQDKGSEYITVFDGTTGAELATIPYHTKYTDESTSFWGDSNQNRSERYLAAIAWLDGEDKNPSPIFARGYYNGAKIGAYDWDGETLSLRWLHRAASANSGTVTYRDGSNKSISTTVYAEGAHWIAVGDCTGDGKQEIVYGSGALKPDGTTLYRTGLGHGDALHLSDFNGDGKQEVFMAHEEKPYGHDLRKADTGEFILHETAAGDTGRGLMADFSEKYPGAEFMTSAHGNQLMSHDGKTVITESWAIGSSGAGINCRLYWNGDLLDDFFDKSIIGIWDQNNNWFNREGVNGTNYTAGSLNNGTKNNPCVLGDLLGDWREEIVTREGDETNGYNLVINATKYTSDHAFPHLMDDYAYRAQIINQNCCYNQPPHVSYNLYREKTITRKPVFIEPTAKNQTATMGKYWDCFYAPYNVKVPDGIKVWALGMKTNGVDTCKVTAFTGTIIPAGSAIIYNASTPEVTFVPTSLTTTSKPSTSYLKGGSNDSIMAASTATRGYYEFRVGDRGLGFYKASGKTIPALTGFATYTGSSTAPVADSYVLGFNSLNPVAPVAVIKGDADDDGDVTMNDANMVVNYFLGVETPGINLRNADVDEDGAITMNDANMIVNIFLGQ